MGEIKEVERDRAAFSLDSVRKEVSAARDELDRGRGNAARNIGQER